MNKCKTMSFVICILLFYIPWPSEGYDVEDTHQTINRMASKSSTLDQYLKNYLGFYEGILQAFDNKRVYEWLEEGGKEEDHLWRPVWHFHDPLKSFESAGLNTPLDQFESSMLWAQATDNDWSWQKARDHYHAGLISSNGEERETNLANCFRTLGQVMHLLADSSVPAHVRNDIHILPRFYEEGGFPQIGKSTYETWCELNFHEITLTSDPPDTSISQLSSDPDLTPITNLWDAYPLMGYSPSGPRGLAEYTNYNFLSLDTVFKDYDYPTNDAIVCAEYTAEDGEYDYVCYYQGQTSDGQRIEHLASVGVLGAEVIEKTFEQGRIDLEATLDDHCFKEYTNILVPKAVGYNAALLDYFFRGSLEITPPGRYLYGIADPGTKAFSEIKLKLRNTTPDEEMGAGVVTAVMKYRLPLNPDFDPVATAPLDTDYVDYDDPDHYAYSVSEPIQVGIISADDPEEFTFTFNGPIPTNALDLSLMVVYRGALGLEQDAVVAQYKDLCEPHHLRFWNNTDYCCVNGTLYSPSEITASPELSRQLDTNGNGKPDIYYFASPVNIYLTFSGSIPTPEPTETTYTVAFHDLPPANYGEVVVLQDQDIYYYSTLRHVIDSSPEDFPGFDFYWYLPDEAFPGHRTYFAYQIDHETDQMGNEFFTYQPRWHRLVPITFRGIPNQEVICFHFTHPYEIACEDSDWPEAPDAQAYPPIINR